MRILFIAILIVVFSFVNYYLTYFAYEFIVKKCSKDKWIIDLESRWIGVIERFFYMLIVCLDNNSYIVIASWLAMKAFSNYQEANKLSRTRFHFYLAGNGISLFGGLFCGFLIKELV